MFFTRDLHKNLEFIYKQALLFINLFVNKYYIANTSR